MIIGRVPGTSLDWSNMGAPRAGGDLNRATTLQGADVMHNRPPQERERPEMIHRSLPPGLTTLAAAGLCMTVVACGGNPKPKATATRPAPSAAAPAAQAPARSAPVVDPIAS